MRGRTALFLPILFVLIVLAQPLFFRDAVFGDQKNLLWKVTSNTATVYLLGSLHFLRKEDYPLNKPIEDAFDSSSVLAVEADLNNLDQADISKFLQDAFYPGDDTLERHVSRETYDLTKKAFEGSGFPLDLVKKQKPWFLALTVSSLGLVKLGFDPNYGVDMHFLSKAKGKKRIEELESLAYQIRLLSGFSDAEQEQFLLYALNDMESVEEEADELLQAWKMGNVKGIEYVFTKYAEEDNRSYPVYEKLIYERNRKMASRIEDYLKATETCFVVVGAGHLVGSKGIVQMLKDKGYSLQQL